jgi:hypothetical protein
VSELHKLRPDQTIEVGSLVQYVEENRLIGEPGIVQALHEQYAFVRFPDVPGPDLELSLDRLIVVTE